MRKTIHSISDIFVKKLIERTGKIVTREEIHRLWTLSGGSKSRSTYGITKAKNGGFIHSFGGSIFLLGKEKPIEQIYWQLLEILIELHSPAGAIVAHEKSIEYHLRNLEIPERIVLYTRDKGKRIKIGKYEFHFRTLKTGEKTGGKNLYHILNQLSEENLIDSAKIRFLSIDAALLDMASFHIHGEGLSEDLFIRFVRRYEKNFSREHLGKLIQYKYIRAINRIRKLSKDQAFTHLYRMSLDIIKNEGGGCYLNL